MVQTNGNDYDKRLRHPLVGKRHFQSLLRVQRVIEIFRTSFPSYAVDVKPACTTTFRLWSRSDFCTIWIFPWTTTGSFCSSFGCWTLSSNPLRSFMSKNGKKHTHAWWHCVRYLAVSQTDVDANQDILQDAVMDHTTSQSISATDEHSIQSLNRS